MSTAQHTRREKQRLTPEILEQYHALLMTNDVAGFERLLAQYAPGLDPRETEKQIEEFKRYAARILQHRWRPLK